MILEVRKAYLTLIGIGTNFGTAFVMECGLTQCLPSTIMGAAADVITLRSLTASRIGTIIVTTIEMLTNWRFAFRILFTVIITPFLVFPFRGTFCTIFIGAVASCSYFSTR